MTAKAQERLTPDPLTTPLWPLWPDAGEWLGLKRSATYAAKERGEIPVVHIGRRDLVPVAELMRMVGLDVPGAARPADARAPLALVEDPPAA